MNVTVRHGLPHDLRDAAACLYWQAFGGKLGRVMGPEPKARAFLNRVMRADHCIVALDDGGQIVGLAGYKTQGGSFAGGTEADLRAVFGRAGAAWRGALLALLGRDTDEDRFLLDGLCVAADLRGQGIGVQLIEAICHEARVQGYTAVQLDVTDTNPRARALYARCGFQEDSTTQIGALRLIFGFGSTHRMVRRL
jgi:ribosomal protein S18 acetylase RimI-like enzyme